MAHDTRNSDTAHGISSPSDAPPDVEEPRRVFLKAWAAGILSLLLGLVPLVLGMLFFLDPLLRKRTRGATGEGLAGQGFVRVTKLADLPADGAPVKFVVRADRSDAWSFAPNQPIGSIFLRRVQGDEVVAFNDICPHVGCKVDYKPDTSTFRCPCHNSAFGLDGARKNDIPPRPLDQLETRIVDGEDVWVKYQQFRAATAEKIPV